MTSAPFTLVKAADRSSWNAALADEHGGCVGLGTVLADLDRRGMHRIVPVRTSAYGFRWDKADVRDTEWWPQGVTHSGDSGPTDLVDGRRVVVVSWYAKPVGGAPSRGSRVSVVDISDPAAPSYRHVLLVQPHRNKESTRLSWEPVRVHAGGIAWHGTSLLVADTKGGVRVFSLDRLVRLNGSPATASQDASGVPRDAHQAQALHAQAVHSDAVHTQYVLPQQTAYRQVPIEGFATFRFSFLAVDRSGATPRLDVGEYGSHAHATRLARFDLATEGLALADQREPSMPGLLDDEGMLTSAAEVSPAIGHMQGVVTVKGVTYLSTSRGRFRRGSMWTRVEDRTLHEHKAALSVGPEDLAYWPQRDQIWGVSEYPGRRFVYAMPRSAFHT